jgi:hypothetical protein
MDKFYTRLTEQKVADKQHSAAKQHGKSKFAALFGPPPSEVQKPFSPEPPQDIHAPPKREQTVSADPIQQMFGGMSMREKPPISPAPGPAGPPSGGDDQAGFARILEMLQGRSNNPTPQVAEAGQPRPPPQSNDSQPKTMTLMQILGGGKAPEPAVVKSPAAAEPAASDDRLRASRSPVEMGHGRQSSQKDELLLNLLKQANQTPKPTPGPEQYGSRPMSGDPLTRANLARNQMVSPDPAILQRRENGRTDQPPTFHYNDEMSPHEYMARRHGVEPPMYDEQLLHSLRGASIPKQGHQPTGPPPGLGRPPGLDQMPPRMPPPGWGAQPPPPPQQIPSRQQGPPPGMPAGRPNIPPGYGMMPPQSQPQRPPQGAAESPQRKYTGEGPIPPMGPPPGFGANGPPPPGMGLLSMFGPRPQQQQQQAPPPRQRYPMQGGPPEQQGMGRAFMDMYDAPPMGGPGGPPPGHNGVRGVGGPMGGYR